MRKIKFRGQTETTEGKKWVYGNYYKVKSFFDNKEAHFIGVIRSNHLTDFSIDENTLGQYTGLHDKNGKEIYEGDIVLYDDWEMSSENGNGDCFTNKGVIEYNESNCCFNVTERIMIDREDVLYEDNETLEVIGNIYENKDLLNT